MPEPIFTTSCFGFKTRVYPTYVSFKFFFGPELNIMIDQIASVELGIPGLQQVVIETTGGMRHRLAVRLGHKERLRDAIYSQM